jgi:hypothetical protein
MIYSYIARQKNKNPAKKSPENESNLSAKRPSLRPSNSTTSPMTPRFS